MIKLFRRSRAPFRKPPQVDPPEVIEARARMLACETAYHTARRDHTASKALRKQWVLAKAQLVALEARAGLATYGGETHGT